jgi:hypothetical protein
MYSVSADYFRTEEREPGHERVREDTRFVWEIQCRNNTQLVAIRYSRDARLDPYAGRKHQYNKVSRVFDTGLDSNTPKDLNPRRMRNKVKSKRFSLTQHHFLRQYAPRSRQAGTSHIDSLPV